MAENVRKNRRENGFDAYVRGVDGKQVWKSFLASKHDGMRGAARAAARWVEDKKRERDNGVAAAPRRNVVTFKEAAEHWHANGVTRKGWRVSTQTDYRSALRVHLYPEFENVPLVKLTDRRLDAWLTKWIAEQKAKSPDGEAPVRTAAKLLMIMGAIFEAARVPFGITDNPARRVEPPRQNDHDEVKPYTKSELVALYRAAASEQDRMIFRVAAELGLRRGELIAARVGDINFSRRVFTVRAAYAHGRLTTPKSRKGRPIKVPRDLAVALDGFLKRRGDPPGHELLFPSAEGGYLDASALRRRFIKACKDAGIRKLRFHDLRHTALSHWGEQGMNVWQMQRQAGHASVQTTQRYTHPLPDDDEPSDPVREQLDELFAQATPAQLEEILRAAVPIASRDEARSRCPGSNNSVEGLQEPYRLPIVGR